LPALCALVIFEIRVLAFFGWAWTVILLFGLPCIAWTKGTHHMPSHWLRWSLRHFFAWVGLEPWSSWTLPLEIARITGLSHCVQSLLEKSKRGHFNWKLSSNLSIIDWPNFFHTFS
jgi:hypothetical protein